ncbi:hypothetical protein M8C21_029299, partial [Ambrosia artemisiifolia]
MASRKTQRAGTTLNYRTMEAKSGGIGLHTVSKQEEIRGTSCRWEDDSSNGLQHYVALGMDKLAVAVNMVQGEKPDDVTYGIASRVMQREIPRVINM